MTDKIAKTLACLVGIYFIIVACMNFYGAPMMVETFEKINIGQWFRYVTALCQLAGGLALLSKKYRFYGALLLVAVMIGALVAKITILQGNPLAVIALLGINGFIAWRSRLIKTCQ